MKNQSVLHNKARKTEIILFIILVLIIAGSILWCLNRNHNKVVPDTKKTESLREKRLKDPNLLYASSSWGGLCRNKKGEEGGCYSEAYFYLDGKYIEESGWDGLRGQKETEPAIEKQLGSAVVEKVKQKIEDGAYGQCTKCGQWIAEGRLELVPTATKCANC